MVQLKQLWQYSRGGRLDWWIKWIATAASLILVITTSWDITPLNKYFGFLAASLWGYLGLLWREPSMYLVNGLFAALYVTGLIAS